MARQQGSKPRDEEGPSQPPDRDFAQSSPEMDENPAASVVPELARRMIALGLSGVFATQETLRQAVGDALPKEWVDFATDQSDRTRVEFLERLAGELARVIESIDLAEVMQQALEGRTLEVTARIRMLPDEAGDGKTKLELSVMDDGPHAKREGGS